MGSSPFLKQGKTAFLTQAAMIAALYAAFTLIALQFSFTANQFRFSEALTILAFFTPAAIPGLTAGCIIANIFSPFWYLDIPLGSLATLLAATVTYLLRKVKFGKFFAPLPPVIFNALIVGAMITVFFPDDKISLAAFAVNASLIGVGEFVVCYGAGLPLLLTLERDSFKALFRRRPGKNN